MAKVVAEARLEELARGGVQRLGRALQRGVTDTVAPRPVPIAPPVETGALELF